MTATWEDSNSTVNYYNNSNYIVSTVSAPIFYLNLALYADSVATLTYDAAGNPLVKIDYQKSLSGPNNSYLPTARYTYSYNAANQKTSN